MSGICSDSHIPSFPDDPVTWGCANCCFLQVIYYCSVWLVCYSYYLFIWSDLEVPLECSFIFFHCYHLDHTAFSVPLVGSTVPACSLLLGDSLSQYLIWHTFSLTGLMLPLLVRSYNSIGRVSPFHPTTRSLSLIHSMKVVLLCYSLCLHVIHTPCLFKVYSKQLSLGGYCLDVFSTSTNLIGGLAVVSRLSSVSSVLITFTDYTSLVYCKSHPKVLL